ncbi:limbin isoform X2 [Myxocyprinus asiaticus]|uniref:limbin isoform X2 n=1 Tax=Myxocyprinus asiaticus TaxID=70543 RepID=UPI002221DB09|nr:limbin isoform X2 [Myxocyprinus asiaticus]
MKCVGLLIIAVRLFMCRLVIVSALLFIVRVHNKPTADHQSNIDTAADHRSISNQDQDKDSCKKEMRRSISSSQTYMKGPASSVAPQGPWGHTLYMLFGQWVEPTLKRAGQRTTRTTVKSAVLGLMFHKCAQVETGTELAQVRVMLVITNPADGIDLSQLSIRDTISDITLLQTNGSVQERGYQTFTTHSLPAGSQCVFVYSVSVTGNRNKILTLPAFLTLSNSTQNEIHLFSPVVANFTLRIKTTQQVDVDHALHFTVFISSFLLTLLLLSVSAVIVNFLLRRLHRCTQHTRRSLSEEAGPYEGMCDITESANEEAAFEDKFIDIMMLEDPQNMIHALDSLHMSTVLRSMVAVERVRVQLHEGVLGVLLGGVVSAQAQQRVLGIVRGQIVGMEGKVQEEHVTHMTTLAAQCNLETREEMQSQQRKHATEMSHAERLFQHAQQQDTLEFRVLLEKLHKEEQQHLQRWLLARHEHVSAQAQRQQALQRRFELHKIFGEELVEATRTGELRKNIADKLLMQYYSCQDSLEEVLDVLVANQRALLTERHAQRRFLLQSLLTLQSVMSNAFDSSVQTHGVCVVSQQCSDGQFYVLRVKQDLEETLRRERGTIRCDIIKRRRQLLSEMVCEHRRELQVLHRVSDVTVNQYLQKWTKLLMKQNTELSELINNLDEETAAAVRKMSLRLLQASLAQLKAHAAAVCPGAARFLTQTELLQDKLQHLGKADARRLRSAQRFIQHAKQQELQEQRRIRDVFREYCSCVCACEASLSHEQRLRVQLECVNAACCLDRCLVLPHAVCAVKLHMHADPAVTPLASEMERRSEVTELQRMQRSLQERMQLLTQHTDTHNDTLQRVWREACVLQEQQLRACEERVAAFLASLQWEQAEKIIKVTETHTALLKLHTLITEELHNTTDITHTLHTHCLALEEAELQLQREEVMWEESVRGWGSDDDDDDDEEVVFGVDSDSSVADLLQEALLKRQQLTQRMSDRVLRRNQTFEHQTDELQLKRLYTYCQQDLYFAAALVKQALLTVPDLHELLRLLLPTVPEGELLSLIDVLEPTAGACSGISSSLTDRLKQDVLSRNLSHSPPHTHRETDRLLRRRQQVLLKLFSAAGDAHETPQRHKQQFPPIRPLTPQLLEETAVASGDEEGAWPNEDVPASAEQLFIFRCAAPAAHLHAQTSHTRTKKRNFLNFKKNSVTPR